MSTREQPYPGTSVSAPVTHPAHAAAFLPVGDGALTVQFGEEVDPAASQRVLALAHSLDALSVEGVLEYVPTYRSLLVSYDPARVRGAALERVLAQRIAMIEANSQTGAQDTQASRLWYVPVVYGGAVGVDLDEIAQYKGLTSDELIALHSGVEYSVYMIGFAPGFAYLGGLPESLHMPRLAMPRQSIPAGAIGIGGQQGSINSVAGPSGWRFVGWTPWRTFDPARTEPFLFAAGDRLRFVPVSPLEGDRIAAALEAGQLTPTPQVAP